MGRKKFKPEEKKINFGITLHPEVIDMLEKQAEKLRKEAELAGFEGVVEAKKKAVEEAKKIVQSLNGKYGIQFSIVNKEQAGLNSLPLIFAVDSKSEYGTREIVYLKQNFSISKIL